MQTKSEMINRIAELAEENAELKAKIKKYAAINEQETKDYAVLKAENDKLKEEVETRDNLIDHFRDGALYRATITIASEYQKDRTKLKQTLQEIKEYAECIGNEEMINGYAIRAKSALWRIAQKITKAEEE